MSELEPRRVQKMPPGCEPRDSSPPSPAVDVVTHDGMSDRREMNANLMGSARVQMRPQQVSWCKAGEPVKIRLRLPSATDDCHPLSVSRVAREGLVDNEIVRVEVSPDHHRVAPRYAARGDGGAENPVRALGLRDEQETRRLLVEPVDDASTLGRRAGGELAAASHQCVHQ